MKTPYLVTVTEQTIKNGYEHDKQQAAKYLEVGKTYEIVEERIFDWHTNVWLREFPGLAFNSVHFETIEKVPAPTVATDNSGEKSYAEVFKKLGAYIVSEVAITKNQLEVFKKTKSRDMVSRCDSAIRIYEKLSEFLAKELPRKS